MVVGQIADIAEAGSLTISISKRTFTHSKRAEWCPAWRPRISDGCPATPWCTRQGNWVDLLVGGIWRTCSSPFVIASGAPVRPRGRLPVVISRGSCDSGSWDTRRVWMLLSPSAGRLSRVKDLWSLGLSNASSYSILRILTLGIYFASQKVDKRK